MTTVAKSSHNPTLVFPSPGRVEIEHRAIPVPEPGHVLIHTRRTLISIGTELTVLSGDFAPDSVWADVAKYPYLPGYDNVGTVVAVGNAADSAWLNRRVATYGTHARYVTAPIEALREVPPAVPDEQAVFFTIAEIVMNGLRRGGVQWGEAVAVYGLGLLGQLTVRFCRLCGARPVLAIDPSAARLARLPHDSAIIPVNPRQADVAQAVAAATRGRQLDVVFEVTGLADLIPGELQMLRTQGRCVILSSPRGKTTLDFHDLCNRPSLTLIGAHNFSHPPQATPNSPWSNLRHAELFFDLIAAGEMDMTPLVSERVTYHEAPRVYAQLLRDRRAAMGVVLSWEDATP